MNEAARQLIAGAKRRDIPVGVVGLGYVGLPVAIALCEKGFKVTGFDVDKEKLKQLRRGQSYVTDVAPEHVRQALRSGFRVSCDFGEAQACRFFLVCVPTPLTPQREPDVSILQGAINSLLKHARPPFAVSIESTSYPGTTEELLVAPARARGWTVGRDVFAIYSPERIDPGNPVYHVGNTPKLVSGHTPACLAVARAFYGTWVEQVVPVKSTKVAETAKLYENIFRSVNVALINELALFCEKVRISVWEVVEAASTKPFGFMPFYPGPGLGGHCLPVDPFYLSWKAREYHFLARFVELAGEVNWYMPFFAVYRIRRALNENHLPIKDSRIGILGLAYKPDVGDLRESPSLQVFQLLKQNGGEVSYHDPYVPQVEISGKVYRSAKLTKAWLASRDCLAVMTAHQAIDWELVRKHGKLIFDARGVYRKKRSRKVVLL